MTKKSLMLVVVIILQLSFLSSFAQTRISVSIGAANPLNSFGSVDSTDAHSNGAAMGAVIGVKVSHQFKESKFSMYGSLDLIYNGLSKGRKEKLDKLYSGIFGSSISYVYEQYLNFPVALGIIYSHEINESVSLMGNVGLAYNFSRITEGGIKTGIGYPYRAEYGWSSSAGYKVGGGILFNNKVSLSLDYFNLGENSFSVKTSPIDIPSRYLIKNTNVASLSLGIWF
ncbi:MAG: hypothetical protein PHD06_03905 [Bacteroidales bacterium]|jgi:hypothetical protein|nr:hypothetical protein [Bacteroidales bacterium]MDD4384302.1 hypothetical protein [Bacteroidales bacterium]MDY0196749.1 hypothetical protein [Tenuifilaceae bacterium]